MSQNVIDSDSTSPGAKVSDKQLKVTEVFYSLQGEARDSGWPTVFIRLTGCPLRCHYCDTAYAFYGGQWHSIDDVLSKVKQHNVMHVCVTGGEPLAQKSCISLLTKLCNQGYQVSLETSGAIDISQVDTRVSRIVDIKTPESGEESKNLWDNLRHITRHDQIKFVIGSRSDYDWSVNCLKTNKLHELCDVLFSPSKDQLEAAELAEWILKDSLPVKFQLQLHKVLWGDAPGK